MNRNLDEGVVGVAHELPAREVVARESGAEIEARVLGHVLAVDNKLRRSMIVCTAIALCAAELVNRASA
jgi:hypothetical protein